MICRKCREKLPESAAFCFRCGAKQDVKQLPKSRGNGQGSVYKLANGKWIAVRVVGYKIDADGVKHKQTVSKSGFKTKREAVQYLPNLQRQQPAEKRKLLTFLQVYEKWEPTHRAGKSTMDCYRAAKKYFAPLFSQNFADIDIDDLQECMDSCPHGKRTQENMKALAGLLYKYAIPRHIAHLNLGQYLIVGGKAGDGKDGLPLDALEKVKAKIGEVPYADYITAQCYLGFRPSELLALDVKDYNQKEKAFVGGSKTDAGKDRVVTVSPKVQGIIDSLIIGKTSGAVFSGEDGSRMQLKNYREAFYEALKSCGVENPVTTSDDGVSRHKYTPHSCRHTFATLIKGIKAPDKDKLELIGHTSTEMLRHYQDVAFDDLRAITNLI